MLRTVGAYVRLHRRSHVRSFCGTVDPRETLTVPQDRDPTDFTLDRHFEDLKTLSEGDKNAVEAFRGALKDGGERASVVGDYELLLAAVQEKVRLTIEWNDTSKMTEAERVKATAYRVGLQVPKVDGA
mmetsp:Transcript_4449/g.6653  ORF Transcript_4449/g.6653 Transcript_4449/m.6653 type:complete len:128 (+) Transcript_4449:70-453(+)